VLLLILYVALPDVVPVMMHEPELPNATASPLEAVAATVKLLL
jgi:hypothetical protein